jgi:Mn2+/Fe2+ NRAMP family transporter
MFVGMAALAKEGSTVMLITLAQAFTVIGIPALALALVYLGTRKDLTGDRRVPRPILALAILGFLVSCVLACLTARKVWDEFYPPAKSVAWSSDQPEKKSSMG